MNRNPGENNPPPEPDTMVAPGNPVQDAPVDALAAAAAPSKKETSLREFLGKMDDYAPIVRLVLLPSFFIHTVIHQYLISQLPHSSKLSTKTNISQYRSQTP